MLTVGLLPMLTVRLLPMQNTQTKLQHTRPQKKKGGGGGGRRERGRVGPQQREREGRKRISSLCLDVHVRLAD